LDTPSYDRLLINLYLHTSHDHIQIHSFY